MCPKSVSPLEFIRQLLYDPLHDVWIVAMEYVPQRILVYEHNLYRVPGVYHPDVIIPKHHVFSEHGAREIIDQVSLS